MILDTHCFPSSSLWLWHKEFHGDNITGNECAISVYGDIITGSDAFRCERTTDFCRSLITLVRAWVMDNCPELIPIGDNITSEHAKVMDKLNTYSITKGWLLEMPPHTALTRYFRKESILWHSKAPYRENMYTETIFLPGINTADLLTLEGLDATYKGLMLLFNLAIQAGFKTVPYHMIFTRSMAMLREVMTVYEQLRPKFIEEEKPAPHKIKKPLFLSDDIHLSSVFTKKYLRTFH